MEKRQWYHNCDPKWIGILKYIRTVSGRVYEDHLRDLLDRSALPGWSRREGKQPIAFLNSFPEGCEGFDAARDHEFLKKDGRTGGIYTVPGVRALLDPAIFSVDDSYVYNRFLYAGSFAEGIARLEGEQAQIRDLTVADVPRLCEEKVFLYKDGRIHIDFSLCSDGCRRFVRFHNFNLLEIYRQVCRYYGCGTDVNIGRMNLQSLIFTGDVQLHLSELSITLDRGIGLNGITCEGCLEMENLVFRFDGAADPECAYDPGQLDLRNARFFDSVKLRDVRLTGDTQGVSLSFEDARIRRDLSVENVDFGNAALFCFQTVMGNFLRTAPDTLDVLTEEEKSASPFRRHRLLVQNAEFGSGSRIDFADAEIAEGEIAFNNIDGMPTASICLAPVQTGKKPGCPRVYLMLRNCNIQSAMTIGNVEKLSFLHSHNYSYVEASEEWQSSAHWRRLRTAGPGGTPIINKLLLAVYNNTDDARPFADMPNGRNQLAMAKARDFIMLKSNFASCNLYDEEDVAFLLYMEYKPVLNSVVLRGKQEALAKPDMMSKLIYRFLYATGKYGISPMRVILSMVLLVLSCTGLYFLGVCLLGEAAFSTGATRVGDLYHSAGMWDKLLASFVYSIEGVIPFVSQFEPINFWVCLVTILENAMGTFLTGYFSVAVIRKTLH